MIRTARLGIWMIATALVAALVAAMALVAGVGFGTAEAQDTTGSVLWQLQAPGVSGAFREVEGLGTALKVVETKVEGSNLSTKKSGPGSAANIVLRRGVTSDLSFSEWHRRVIANGTSGNRKNGSIVAFDNEGQPVLRFNFTGAWPAQYRVVEQEDGLVVEEITLAVNDLRRVQ